MKVFEFFHLFRNKQNLQSMNTILQNTSINKFIRDSINRFSVLDMNSIERLSFIQYKPNGAYLFYDPKDDTRLERITIKLNQINVQQQLLIYSWRKKTKFPIVKTKYAQLIKQQKNSCKVNIYHEVCDVKLSQLSDIPLNQAIYLLKESIIGFQRLFSLFGAFQITPNMICTNQKGQCKIWFNERFQINSFIPSTVTQFQQIRKIKTILSARVLRTKTAIEFFQQLHEAQNIIELLDIIQEFVTAHRIQVPNVFSLISYSVLRNTVKRFHSQQPPPSDIFSSLSRSSQRKRIKQCKSNGEKSEYNQQMNQKLMSTEKITTKNIALSNLITTSKLNPFEKFAGSSTTKLSTNTTNTQSLKAFFNNNSFYDEKQQKRLAQPKVRKASLKNMTNSYEIRQGFQQEPLSRYFSAKKLQKHDILLPQPTFEQSIRKITPIQSKIVEDQGQQQSARSSDEGISTSEIYRKNGWNSKNKIQGIFKTQGPVKHSIKIGKQFNPQNQNHQFKILKPPGLVYQSILPDEQNE